MVEDLCIRWRTILRVISIDESSSLWDISREKIFWGLKIILWTFSRYSSCFMWNVATGRSSGRRAERFLCEAILCGKMTTFWEDSGRLSNSKMKTTCLICWTISSFSRCCRCYFSRCYCSCQHWRSVLVSDYCLYWPFLHVISVLIAVTWKTGRRR